MSILTSDGSGHRLSPRSRDTRQKLGIRVASDEWLPRIRPQHPGMSTTSDKTGRSSLGKGIKPTAERQYLKPHRVPGTEFVHHAEGSEHAERTLTHLRHKSLDPYTVLELSHDADPEQIKRQYHKLVRQYHPDRHMPALFEKYREISQKSAQLMTSSWILSSGKVMVMRLNSCRHRAQRKVPSRISDGG